MESKVSDPVGTISTVRKRTKSVTKSSTRRALESTVTEFDELLASAELKEGKRGDVLIAKANALKELLALEIADRETETQDTVTRLEDQHATDIRRISDLEAENKTLRSKPPMVQILRDPEHEAIRQQNAALTRALAFAVEDMTDDERARVAVRATQTLSRDAFRELCNALALDWKMYLQLESRGNYELQQQVSAAQVRGPAAVAAEAILANRGVKPANLDDWN